MNIGHVQLLIHTSLETRVNRLDASPREIAGYFASGDPSVSIDWSSFDGYEAR